MSSHSCVLTSSCTLNSLYKAFPSVRISQPMALQNLLKWCKNTPILLHEEQSPSYPSHILLCKIVRRQHPLKNFPSACIITRAEYAKVTHQFSRLQHPLINHIVTVDSMTINTILIGRFTLTQIECFHYISTLLSVYQLIFGNQ